MKQLVISAVEVAGMDAMALLDILHSLDIIDVVYLNDVIEIKEKKEDYYE